MQLGGQATYADGIKRMIDITYMSLTVTVCVASFADDPVQIVGMSEGAGHPHRTPRPPALGGRPHRHRCGA